MDITRETKFALGTINVFVGGYVHKVVVLVIVLLLVTERRLILILFLLDDRAQDGGVSGSLCNLVTIGYEAGFDMDGGIIVFLLDIEQDTQEDLQIIALVGMRQCIAVDSGGYNVGVGNSALRHSIYVQ